MGLRRPGDGLPPYLFEQLIGCKATRNIAKGVFLNRGDFK